MGQKNFPKIERILQKKFTPGIDVHFDNKRYRIVKSGKPVTSFGEPKTDLYILLAGPNGDVNELKISVKMDNYEFILNKPLLETAIEVMGPEAQLIITRETLSIREKFLNSPIIQFNEEGKIKKITLGWRFELFKDTKRQLSTNPYFTDDQKISIFSGEYAIDKRNASLNGELIEGSGVANMILVVPKNPPEVEKLSPNSLLGMIVPISDYARSVHINTGFCASNYFPLRDKWEGDRALAVWIDWSFFEGKMKPCFIFENPLERRGNEIAAKTRQTINQSSFSY